MTFQIYSVYTAPDTGAECHKYLGHMVTKPLARSVVEYLQAECGMPVLFIRDKQTEQVEWHRQRQREAADGARAVLENMLEGMGCKIVDATPPEDPLDPGAVALANRRKAEGGWTS